MTPHIRLSQTSHGENHGGSARGAGDHTGSEPEENWDGPDNRRIRLPTAAGFDQVRNASAEEVAVVDRKDLPATVHEPHEVEAQ
ncbi:MAG: hypothetical protein Q9186_002870 [Xanthomendoza sp. 1 TL-2023]